MSDGPDLSTRSACCQPVQSEFQPACALLLPEVASVQIQRGVANNTTVSEISAYFLWDRLLRRRNADVPKLLRDLTGGSAT